ncbi:MAG: DUF3108 domain-containing protein [Terriglobales bacterium]
MTLNRIFQFACWCAVLALVISASADQTATTQAATTSAIGPLSRIQRPPENFHLPSGTTYVYGAEWRLWTAGTASIRIETTGQQQRVTGSADATGVTALLFGVRDRFESYFDPHTFCSQRIFKHTEEGFHKRETSISFDYGRRKSVLDEVNLRNGDRKHTEQEIPSCVTDVLSGVFYASSLPLQVGSEYLFPINDGGKTIDVRLHVEAREQVKTDAGTFPTLRVQPEASSGVLKDRGRVWIWYSDDARRIPVQVRARMFWGTLTLRLQRVERQTP